MRHSHLAWIVATVCLVGACASGGDSDDGSGSGDDSGSTVEASTGPAHDSGAPAIDSSQPRNDSSAVLPDSSSSAMDSATKEASAPQDSGSVPETSTPAPDSGPPGVCPDDAKYGIEAAADVFSGNFTLCLLGAVCAAGQCCYEELNPGNVCVAL